MDREVLFRGKTEHYGFWVYGSLVSYPNNTYIITNTGTKYSVELDSVGQYTGMKDNTCTHIFEGDILKRYGYKFIADKGEKRGVQDEVVEIGIVEWSDESLSFLFAEDDMGVYKYYGVLEVIGNIYDDDIIYNKKESE